MTVTKRPKVNSKAQTELDKIDNQFKEFDNQVKEMTMERMNAAPKEEVEPQTKLSSKEIEKSKDLYLKPKKRIGDNQKFNEKFRADWEFQKEYVHFIAEHREIRGDIIEIWTHPFGGVPAEYWEVPTNKPIWGPRYLAEQIQRKCYHRLMMDQKVITESTGMGQMYGALTVDTTVQRLDATPVSSKKSVFMGKRDFSAA